MDANGKWNTIDLNESEWIHPVQNGTLETKMNGSTKEKSM